MPPLSRAKGEAAILRIVKSRLIHRIYLQIVVAS